jgi:hypothetical protein
MGLSKFDFLAFQEDLVPLFFEVFLSGGFWVFCYLCPHSAFNVIKLSIK